MSVTTISPRQLADLCTSGKIDLIDVRTRTSSLKRIRNRSGVTTSSLSRSVISPPR